jgi:hypothetical protein
LNLGEVVGEQPEKTTATNGKVQLPQILAIPVVVRFFLAGEPSFEQSVFLDLKLWRMQFTLGLGDFVWARCGIVNYFLQLFSAFVGVHLTSFLGGSFLLDIVRLRVLVTAMVFVDSGVGGGGATERVA